MEVVEDFLLLDIGSSDVILEMKWLLTLDQTKVDWKALTIKIQVGRTTMTLQGDPSLTKTLVTLKTMMKAFKERGNEYFLNWVV